MTKDFLNKEIKIGDLVIARKLVGNENSFFGIIQKFDDFLNEEEKYNYYKSEKMIVIKPLCTLNGDELSESHELDKDGNIRLGTKSHIRLINKNKFKEFKNQAIKRAKKFKEIEI